MIAARGFPSDLDGHPQVAWMGDDWVAHVAGEVESCLGVRLVALTCEGRSDVVTRVDGDGGVRGIEVSLTLTAIARTAGGHERLEGVGRFSPGGSAFEIDARAPVELAVLACDACELEAGMVQLDESGLRRETFTGVLRQPLGEADRERVRSALADPEALFGLDPELAPFWCPECARTYCGRHWARWDVFDEEGFHDSIRGRCPAGHERMLED